jgi:homoserine/homoserine lactone efflux protein
MRKHLLWVESGHSGIIQRQASRAAARNSAAAVTTEEWPMPETHLFLAFVATVTIIMLIPGPNVALIVANSVAHGTRYGLLTVAGTSSAMVLQLALTALGMEAVLGRLGVWFDWVRWAGVVYLLYLGIRQWRAPPTDLAKTTAEPKSPRAILARAFLVSLTNPKTLFFYGAFFPQFVSPAHSLHGQVAVLSATFLAIALVVDGGWACAAGHARGLLARHGKARNRLSGGILIGAGVALAAARTK